MNRFDIRDILQAHKEHFRVLPDGARNAIEGIIQQVDYDATWAAHALKLAAKEKAEKKKPVKKETPAESLTVGKVAKKKAKKKGK